MRISIESKGTFRKTEKALRGMTNGQIYRNLKKYAEKGRIALAKNTPEDTGKTGDQWAADVIHKGSSWSIVWRNRNVEDGIHVVILLQYGHATGTGGYVRGTDFINPVIKPLFDEIANDVWKEVTRL